MAMLPNSHGFDLQALYWSCYSQFSEVGYLDLKKTYCDLWAKAIMSFTLIRRDSYLQLDFQTFSLRVFQITCHLVPQLVSHSLTSANPNMSFREKFVWPNIPSVHFFDQKSLSFVSCEHTYQSIHFGEIWEALNDLNLFLNLKSLSKLWCLKLLANFVNLKWMTPEFVSMDQISSLFDEDKANLWMYWTQNQSFSLENLCFFV